MRKKYNFPMIIDGDEYWFSRSTAVVCFLYTNDDQGQLYILANKRGPGCPDYVGKWNAPCGFLDYNETAAEGAAREVYEECGVVVDPHSLVELKADSDPRSGSGNQSINIRFCSFIENGLKLDLNADHSEKNEVDEIKWIPLNELDEYDWAFTHKSMIFEMWGKYQTELFLMNVRECVEHKNVSVIVNDGNQYKLFKMMNEEYLKDIKDIVQINIVDCKLYNYDGEKIFDSNDVPAPPRKF